MTRVCGPFAFGAFCPQRSLAREASTWSLVTCHAGLPRRGIDPVGETYNVPDTPLGTRHLVPCAASIFPSETAMVIPNEQPKKPDKPRKSTELKKPDKPGKSSPRSFPIPVPSSTAPLQVINPDAAGIDV